MIRKSCILLIVLVFSGTFLRSQYPHYHHYTSENILPANEIYCLLEDQKGYIWIGSDAGIFQFNGESFRSYKNEKLNSLAATGLIECSDGQLVAYNFNGQLFSIQKNHLKIIPKWNHKINSLAAGPNNKLWISSDAGCFTLNCSTHTFTDLIPKKYYAVDNPGHYTHAVKYHRGSVYFYNQSNLFELKNNHIRRHKIPTNNNLQLFFTCFNGPFPWIVNQTGDELYILKKSGVIPGKFKSLQQLLKNRKITQIREINENETWICTFSGIIRYQIRENKATLYWPEMAFSDCLKDKNDAYWFSTLNNGLLYVNHLQQVVWNKNSTATLNEQFTHITAAANTLISGNNSGDLFLYDLSSQSYSIDKLPAIGDIGLLVYDEKDQCFYLNQSTHLLRLKNGRITLVNKLFRPAKDLIRWNDAYILATSQGTYRVERLDNETTIQPFHTSWSRSLLKPSFSEELWVATNDGLMVFDQRKKHIYSKKKILNGIQILSLCEVGKSVYALTFKGQLVRISPDHKILKRITIDSDARFHKLKQYKHYLLIGSNDGIFVFNTKNGNIRQLRKENGLVSNSVRDITVLGDDIWLATNNGVQKIFLPVLSETKKTNHIYLNRILINGKESPFNNIIHLNHSDYLEVYADGLSYHSLGEFEWEYRLNKDNWLSVDGRSKKLSFANMPSGSYPLEIRLKDHYGNYSEQKITLQLHVKPPFYQRWWFYLLLIITIAFFAFVIYRRRIRSIERKQLKELQRIQLESDLRWSQQNALKAQMNPHFLFNVLQSIKGFIYENDKTSAIKYLDEFSSLVRDVLENSSLSYISLQKELEFLSVYIDLESMLLDSDFEFTLQVDEKVDMGYTEIPSMILQPFVENAFKHGLRYLKGQKKLMLTIAESQKDDKITIVLEDNGIGLKKSREMNTSFDSRRRSFASAAITQRIELLNSENPGSVQVFVEDKQVSESGRSSGTIVRIIIKRNR